MIIHFSNIHMQIASMYVRINIILENKEEELIRLGTHSPLKEIKRNFYLAPNLAWYFL